MYYSSAYFKQVDVSSWEQQVDLFKFILATFKRLDYVFANAGIFESPFLASTSSKEVTFVKPDLKTLDVNNKGAFYTSSLAVQVFRTQEIVDGFRGKLVVTGSVVSVFYCLCMRGVFMTG